MAKIIRLLNKTFDHRKERVGDDKVSTEKISNIFSPALKAIQLIREKEGKKRGVRGEIACPECQKPFRYSIASSNGHIHGKCTSCGVAFMM